MISDTDLPQQPDTLQHHSRSFKPLSWIVIISLLLIVNVKFVSWAAYELSPDRGGANLSGFVVLPASLPLAILDFLVVYLYLRKQYHQGIVKVIGYIIFIAVSLVLTSVAWGIGLILLSPLLLSYIGLDSLIFIESLPFSVAIVIVFTILIVLFLHPKFSKKR